MKCFKTLPLMLAATSTTALNVNEKKSEEPSLSSTSSNRSPMSSTRSPASSTESPASSTKRPESSSLVLDKPNSSPAGAPCQDDTKVSDAMDCVADYARDGKCDGENWTKMYINCELPGARIDDYLLPIVEANECTWERWSDGVYLPLFDDYLKDCSNNPPADAPCQDDAKVPDAMDCVADYARDGKCDWENWNEMYINCELPGARIDDYLLPIVEANECTWERWSDGVYLPLFDDYLKDCSGDGGGNNNGGRVHNILLRNGLFCLITCVLSSF